MEPIQDQDSYLLLPGGAVLAMSGSGYIITIVTGSQLNLWSSSKSHGYTMVIAMKGSPTASPTTWRIITGISLRKLLVGL